MREISIVQKLVTFTVIILMLVIGITVILNDDKQLPPSYNDYVPVPSPTSEPIPVYPNNGKE